MRLTRRGRRAPESWPTERAGRPSRGGRERRRPIRRQTIAAPLSGAAAAGPGDARSADRAGRRPAGGGLARAAAVCRRAGAVRGGRRARLCPRPADDPAEPARVAALGGGADDGAGDDRRRAAVRAAAVSADPVADRPVPRPHPAIRAAAAALGEQASSPICSRISAPMWSTASCRTWSAARPATC